MSDQLKYVVQELNKSPLNKSFNLISFDSLNSEQLLQVLTDVLALIDTSNKVDIRTEEPEQTTIRILGMLRVLKYKPGPETPASVFRQGLVQGDKHIIHPILEWLFQNMEALKKRAYLSKYLVKVEVPPDKLADQDLAALYEQYENLIEDFKAVHKESEVLKKSANSIAELRTDIEAMEKEKEIVLKRIERMERKIENLPTRDAMLEAAHALRLEREREKELELQKHEQQTILHHTEQRAQRLQKQLKELRQSAVGATPKGLLQRLEEETNVNTYIVKQKLPKEIEMKKQEVEILQNVASDASLGRGDLETLNRKIQEVNNDVNQLVERHLAMNDPVEDKLAPFRQQAAIIGRKKESAAEQLRELKNRLSSLEANIQEKQEKLKEFTGERVLHEEEFKQYVNKLKGRSALYKQNRAALSALKAEAGVLTRTLELLNSKNVALLRELSVREAQHGVLGFRATEERLEEVSSEKADVDQEKGKTLEEMSSVVVQLTQRIASRKALLAPIIKELRPLREQCQEVTTEYEQKKQIYDSTAAGLESTTAKIEQEVRALKDEINSRESQIALLEAQCNMTKVKLEMVSEEIQLYVSSTPADKNKSMREKLTNLINEQEKLSRQLKEEQRTVKEHQTNHTRQMKLWSDLQKLMECKKRCHQAALENSGVVHREKGAEYWSSTKN
ncbi:intraflagellar transport protein 81 homolog isoform X1 [Schistocerca piceifrons]|uniref:intraflagellar transport protein 81 homolog isoform X1 n=2 Tax=Schistocerca piceifrons TaxID=274613 RepID=UPI001F5E40BC|nr:intraflagellar transport protein 81 homolog isoform X1 [Schistocerca piceifrons]